MPNKNVATKKWFILDNESDSILSFIAFYQVLKFIRYAVAAKLNGFNNSI